MTKTATKKRKLSPGGALLRLREDMHDRQAIAAIVSGTVGTLEEVAHAFGVTSNTVKQSGRPQGMPGKSGAYKLTEIAHWRLTYLDEKEGGGRSASVSPDRDLARRLKEAEVEKVEIDVESRRIKLEQVRGEVIDRNSVVSTQSKLIRALQEHFLTSPEDFAPELPPDQSVQIIERWRENIARGLKRFAEQSAREVVRRAS